MVVVEEKQQNIIMFFNIQGFQKVDKKDVCYREFVKELVRG